MRKIFIKTATLAAFGVFAAVHPTEAASPSAMTNWMDTTADPCEDFYQYACGTWIKDTVIPASESRIGAAGMTIKARNQVALLEIMKENRPLIGELWDSCMDESTLESLGNQPIQPMLTRISAVANKTELFTLAGELSAISGSLVTSIGARGNVYDAKNNVLYVREPESLTLPEPSYYLKTQRFQPLEAGFRKYISTVMKLSGFSGTAAQSQIAVGDSKHFEDTVINIERKVAVLINRTAAKRGADPNYNSTSLGEAMATFPLTIGAFFNGAVLGTKSTLSESSKVLFSSFEFFELAEKEFASIPLEDLKTYVAFQLVHARALELSKPFADAHFEFFSKKLKGSQAPLQRAEHCTRRMTELLPYLVGKYYVLRMFDKEREEGIQLVTALIEKAMGEHIAKLDWLDDPTRAQAADKLSKILNLMGQSSLNKTYPFVLRRDGYFQNVVTILKNNRDTLLRKPGTPVDRNEWSMAPTEVNAYYSRFENKMVFPAAILQPPYFDGKNHPALNFGAIGSVIGHELTHGFGSLGRAFDGDGNKRSWWSNTTSAEYDKRAACMREQYSGFEVKGENGTSLGFVDGGRTISENIADNGGLSLAWDAYHAYLERPEAAAHMDGVTPAETDKLFFIAFAQSWCGKSRDDALAQQIATDAHAPVRIRVNGATMNSFEFSQVFQCTPGSKMNPESKCKIW